MQIPNQLELVLIPDDAIVLQAANFVCEFYGESVLDYSLVSLAAMDRVLGHFVLHNPTAEERDRMVKLAGCYMLEVARKSFGGRYFWWVNKSVPVFVHDTVKYAIGLSPFGKVRSRIEQGDEENIPFFFAEYVTAMLYPCIFSQQSSLYIF